MAQPLPKLQHLAYLPTTAADMRARGWDEVDVVFVTGDAYIDHPSFAMAILGRVLEKAGYRVAILSQPDWKSCEPWRQFGRPRLFFAVSAGNMDSLINHYTANKKFRNDDAYSPGGKIGLRPDRATLPYCQRAREAYPGVPVIAGGVEASLRRLAHYDYWSDTVRRSILLDSKADLVGYGMGETGIVEIADRLAKGQTMKDLRNMRGVAYTLGASENVFAKDARFSQLSKTLIIEPTANVVYTQVPLAPHGIEIIPSFEKVQSDKMAFVEATRSIHLNTNPFNAKTLIQLHDQRAVVVNPPALPLSESQMDAIYGLPYTRRPHPSYTDSIPAFEMIKDSISIMRGCFGGCTFCSITAHQGRIIQSRSKNSILEEIKSRQTDADFKGVISDIGGPTANMYQMRCTRPDIEQKCRRLSCVHPTICKLLGADHQPLIDLMKEARETPGVRKVFVASGIRMDLAQLSPQYMKDLAAHHVGGHLKVAPEHTDPDVLRAMKKPNVDNFGVFAEGFKKASEEAGKPKQFLVPYFIASHPGSGLNEMIDLALYLKRNGFRPDQVQDFIPAPFDIATCMYYTGIDPMTRKPVYVAKKMNERKFQRALMQFFKPENYFEVRKALEAAGRSDLIGDGCDGLIGTRAPKAALEARRMAAHKQMAKKMGKETKEDRYVHQIPIAGYRPGRTTAKRNRPQP